MALPVHQLGVMDEAKLSEYRQAVHELIEAVKALGRDSPDWDAANQRIADAERKCTALRNALSRSDLRVISPNDPLDSTSDK